MRYLVLGSVMETRRIALASYESLRRQKKYKCNKPSRTE